MGFGTKGLKLRFRIYNIKQPNKQAIASMILQPIRGYGEVLCFSFRGWDLRLLAEAPWFGDQSLREGAWLSLRGFQGLGFRVYGLGFRGLGVQGLGFRGLGLCVPRLGASLLGFVQASVKGSQGFRALDLGCTALGL